MNSEDFSFGNILERDIDTMLMYSFAIDKEFLSLFTQKLNSDLDNAEVIGVELSKVDGDGESDITVLFSSNEKTYALLIEDKIDAIHQDDQCARYYKRGESGIKDNEYENFFVFICAPQNYIDTESEAKKYEYSISYEEIESYLESRDSVFDKLRLCEIQQALYKARNPYQRDADESATSLWLDYIDYVHATYPDLQLCDSVKDKPKDGAWLNYKTQLSHPQVQMVHKVNFGWVDLQFGKMKNYQPELADLIRDAVGDYEKLGFGVFPASGSASLRKDFGVENKLDFN